MVEQKMNPFNLPSYWSDDKNGNRKLSNEILRPNSSVRSASASLAPYHMIKVEASNIMELTMFDSKNERIMLHEFYVTPSQLSIEIPGRVGVYQTLSGDSYVDHLGAGLPTITMSGTIGPSPLLGPIGWVQFSMLREFVDTYYERCKVGNAQGTRLVLSVDFNDSPHFGQWDVTIVNFKMERSAKGPLTHSYSLSFAALDSKSPTNLHKFDVYREKRRNLITSLWNKDDGNGRQLGFNTGRYKTLAASGGFSLPAFKKDQLDLYSPEKYITYRTPSEPTIQEFKERFGYPPDSTQKVSEFRYYDSISSGLSTSGNPNSYKRVSLGNSTSAAESNTSTTEYDYAYAANNNSNTQGFSGTGSVQANVATIIESESLPISGCLTVGQTLVGKGIIVGTKVLKINSGSGKAGTYIIDTYHSTATEDNIEITGWVFTNQMVSTAAKIKSEIYFNASTAGPFTTLDDISYNSSRIRGKINYLHNKTIVGPMTRSRFFGSSSVSGPNEPIILEVSNAVRLTETVKMSDLPNGTGINLLFAINIFNELFNHNEQLTFNTKELSPAVYINGFLQERYTYEGYGDSVKQTILEIIKNKYPNLENMTDSKINEIATWIAVQSNLSVSFTEKLPWGTELRIPRIL